MNRLSRFLVTTLLSLTMFGMVACSGGDSAPATSAPATSAPATSAPTPTAVPTATAKPVPTPTSEPVPEPTAEAKPDPTATPKPTAVPATATPVPPTATPAPTPIPTPYAGPNLGLNADKVFQIHVPADASAKARLVSLGINVPQTGSLEEANHEFMAGLNVDPGYKERWMEHQASVNSVLGA